MPDTPPREEPAITAEDAARYLPDSLKRPPIFDLLNATPGGRRQLAMIRNGPAKKATDHEVAQFLELCAQYSLDWNANEAWCAVSENNGKRNVLLMVGRNGLRKIAQRQGLDFDGDVVREHDRFVVERQADRTRTIEHAYVTAREQDSANRQGKTTAAESERGRIVGAWCEVYDVVTGRQKGYFYAELSEYRPTSEAKLRYSPWGSQESVMICAAAERQALGQATPLGGLVAVGELDLLEERRATIADLTAGGEDDIPDADVVLPPAVEVVIARARQLGHAGLANRSAAAMATADQPEVAVKAWVAAQTAVLNRMAAGRPPEADRADEGSAEAQTANPMPAPGNAAQEPAQAPTAGEDAALTPEEQAAADDELGTPIVTADGTPITGWVVLDPERIEALRRRVHELVDQADIFDAEDDPRASEVREEAAMLMAQIDEADAASDRES